MRKASIFIALLLGLLLCVSAGAEEAYPYGTADIPVSLTDYETEDVGLTEEVIDGETALCWRTGMGSVTCYLVYCRLHGDKVFSRFAVAVIDDLNHMVILRKQTNRVGERPLRLRRARQKQQRLFMSFSIFQSSHTIRPLVFAALFGESPSVIAPKSAGAPPELSYLPTPFRYPLFAFSSVSSDSS